jgi:chorismate mutase
MTDDAIDRARKRLEEAAEGRPDAAAVDAVLERARAQVEELAQAAAQIEATLPAKIDDALQDGLREQVRPVGRNLAEIRGLSNQVIRRLERIEGDLLAERHARVDDLALLVDLITSGWKTVDDRLGSLEKSLGSIEKSLQTGDGAIVYRIEERGSSKDLRAAEG